MSDLPSTVSATRTVEIPVVYGGESGPDLGAVAEFAECSEEDVVRLHASRAYRVYMLGFLPGFAYMGSVDPRIAMPRLDAPRLRVAAGSVGIAAAQTGIYPCGTPWGLAHHRPDLDEGFRCGEDRTLSVESRRLRDVRARVNDGWVVDSPSRSVYDRPGPWPLGFAVTRCTGQRRDGLVLSSPGKRVVEE